jgi:hypothetical protein
LGVDFAVPPVTFFSKSAVLLRFAEPVFCLAASCSAFDCSNSSISSSSLTPVVKRRLT